MRRGGFVDDDDDDGWMKTSIVEIKGRYCSIRLRKECRRKKRRFDQHECPCS